MAGYKYGKSNRELSKVKFLLRRYYIYLVVLGVLAAGIVATLKIYDTTTAPEESKKEASTVKLMAADTYYLAMYEPDSFNVIASTDEDVLYLNQIVYSSLFKLDDTLNITPDLVNSYSVDSDKGAVRINLRQDAYFSNGTPVTSTDVEKTIGWIKNNKSSPYYNYASKIGKVSIEGDKDLMIQFANPDNAALDNLVFPILSASNYKKGERFALGSGQYAYSSYDKGKLVRLKPNEYYYGGTSNNSIEVMFVKDKSIIPGMATLDAVTAFISKEQFADNIAEDKSLKCISLVSSEVEYLGFNCQKDILSDSKMRQAIAFAIDREKTILDDYGADAVAPDSFYYPGFLGSDKSDSIKFDPKTSSEIMSAKKLKDIDEDGILETESGEDVSFKLIVNSGNANRVDAANSIAEDLKSIGISIEVVKLKEDDFNNALSSGNFDLFLAGLKIDKQFNLLDLYDELNFGNFEGETVERLTMNMEKTHTNEEQKAIFRDLKSVLYDEMPYFAICYRTFFFISTDTLETTDIPQFFNPYRNIGSWVWLTKTSPDKN